MNVFAIEQMKLKNTKCIVELLLTPTLSLLFGMVEFNVACDIFTGVDN